MNPQIKSVAALVDYHRYVELRMFSDTGEQFCIAKPLVMEVRKDDGMYSEPMARLTKTEAQGLIDALWNCGLRPTEGSGSAGAMAAVQEHLKDMRKLVFDGVPKT